MQVSKLSQAVKAARFIWELPKVRVKLMGNELAGNDPFFSRVVREFYADTRRRHPRVPFIRRMKYGVALTILPPTYEEYFAKIEASARRNVKKAQRAGYECIRVDLPDYKSDIETIRRSATVRQGALSEEFLKGEVVLNRNPESRTNIHDYPSFAVIRDERAYAYCGCLVAGQMCALQHIYGHADFQADGIVPLLITDVARHLLTHFPKVRYYMYGTYFGAGESMQRFKRKFGFVPHTVSWDMN